MTASNTAGGAATTATGATGFAPALSGLLQAGLRYATAKASRKLEDWADDLNDVVARGGSVTRAVAEGVKAVLEGKNPVWAAIKGAWSGASPQQKLVVWLILLVALLLAPVVLLLLVLALLVFALVAGIRAATR